MLVSPGLVYQACIFCGKWLIMHRGVRVDTKLWKNFVFDSVNLIYWKRFRFQQIFWAMNNEKSYLHGTALPEFFIFRWIVRIYSQKVLTPTFVYSFLSVGTISRVPGCGVGTKFRWHILELVPTFTTRVSGLFVSLSLFCFVTNI